MFSLAVVLYEMLTGVRVFQRDSAAASLAAVLEHEVDPDPRIEPRLWVTLSRALAKRPYERYATCGEFAEALRSALDAGDEDLAQSLQELRPRSELLPDSGAQQGVELGAGSSNASAQRSRARKAKSRSGSPVWIAAIAGGAALLAVILTLAFTRSRGSADGEDARAAAAGAGGATPTTSAVLATQGAQPTQPVQTTAPRDEVPPPPPPSPVAEGTASASASASASAAPAADFELPSTPAKTAAHAQTSRTPATRSWTGTAGSKGTTPKSGGAKPVATRPDF
jgi:serine/threonine protein kinase